VHSAEDWEEVLLPEIERQQGMGKEVVFRADAAFAKPEIYEAMEERGEVCDSDSRERQPGARHRGTADAPGGAAQSQTDRVVQGLSLPSRQLEDRTTSSGEGGIPCRRVVPATGVHRDQPYSDPERQILRARFPQQSPRCAAVKISVSELRMKFSAGSLQWTGSRQPAVTSRPTKHKMFFSRVSSSGMRFVSRTNTQMTSRPLARLSIRISRETKLPAWMLLLRNSRFQQKEGGSVTYVRSRLRARAKVRCLGRH
jgi:hypothetical protein